MFNALNSLINKASKFPYHIGLSLSFNAPNTRKTLYFLHANFNIGLKQFLKKIDLSKIFSLVPEN